MYRHHAVNKTSIAVNESYEGETLETKIQRLVQNKEPMDGSVPLTYTERKDGVQPQYDIRTDRWEIAAEAMDTYTKSIIAQRDNKGKAPNGKEANPETGGSGEPAK